jgi:hypothetical protein
MMGAPTPEISLYRRLCTVHGRAADRTLMAIFRSYDLQAYWDDSQTVHFCTMLGYAGTVEQLERFDESWNGVKREFGVVRPHMTDFVAQHGEFEHGWRDPKKRAAFLGRLARAIGSADLRGVSASIPVAVVKSCNERWNRKFSAYAVAAALCMESFKDYFPKRTAEIWLDRIDNGRRELDAAETILSGDPWYRDWWQEEHVSWAHLTKDRMKESIPVKEAADFAAWEARINAGGLFGFTDKWQGSHWSKARQSAVALIEAAPISGWIYTEGKLMDLYARLEAQ